MTDFNDDPFDGSGDDSLQDFESATLPSARPPKSRSNNRNFWIILGVLVGVFVLALIVLGVLAMIILPQRNAARLEEAAQINAQNTATLEAATQNALAAAQAALATQTSPPPVPQQTTSTSTPVIVFASPTAEATSEPVKSEETEEGIGGPADDAARTATLAYLLTQAATTQPDSLTQTAAAAAIKTQTALPETGFAEQVGLPGMLGLAAILIVLVFLARKLRLSQT